MNYSPTKKVVDFLNTLKDTLSKIGEDSWQLFKTLLAFLFHTSKSGVKIGALLLLIIIVLFILYVIGKGCWMLFSVLLPIGVKG
jgi:hypothetical protein